MYDHSPPVDWPSCSWTRTCSRTDQPCPPASTGNEPPCSRASIAARRIGSPQSRGTRPPARSNSTSRGWSTSRDERAGARLQLELGGRQGQVHRGKDAPPRWSSSGRVAGNGTRPRTPGRSRPHSLTVVVIALPARSKALVDGVHVVWLFALSVLSGPGDRPERDGDRSCRPCPAPSSRRCRSPPPSPRSSRSCPWY